MKPKQEEKLRKLNQIYLRGDHEQRAEILKTMRIWAKLPEPLGHYYLKIMGMIARIKGYFRLLK
jgi:hypothetical protein